MSTEDDDESLSIRRRKNDQQGIFRHDRQDYKAFLQAHRMVGRPSVNRRCVNSRAWAEMRGKVRPSCNRR